MTSIADGSVQIQTSAESVPSTPTWFGEIVLLAAHLRKQGIREPDQRACVLCTTAVRALRGCDMKSFQWLSQRRKS
jgi:hypothetical protein